MTCPDDEDMTTLQQQAKALGDPTRHAIFRLISTAPTAVGIADINAQFPFNHNAIRQHLAKLVAAGLVSERRDSVVRPGRPRLVYEPAPGVDSRWGLVGPYERLSLLLAEIVESGDPPVEVGRRAGRAMAGSVAGVDGADKMMAVMARQGFEPELRRKPRVSEIVFQQCPFESAALSHGDIICTLHLGIAEGLAEGTNVAVSELVAKDPRRDDCRLRFRIVDGGRRRDVPRAPPAPEGASDRAAPRGLHHPRPPGRSEHLRAPKAPIGCFWRHCSRSPRTATFRAFF